MAAFNAWDRWWQQATANGQTHCLPFLDQSTKDALLAFWGDFANPLPRKAKCIDLASGSGIVISMMLNHRTDLQCIGIDASPQIGATSKAWESRPGVRMECLPFNDASFDAVTSQFGLEYGDQATIVGEVARVIKRGGHFGFVIHNKAGPVVAHNKKRADALRWAARDAALIEKAKRWVSLPLMPGVSNLAAFQKSVSDAVDRFGEGSGAHEFSLAVLQTLSLRGRQPAQEILMMLDRLNNLVSGELARLDALANAALSEKMIGELSAMLGDKNLKISSIGMLPNAEPSEAIAWALRGQKSV